MKTRRAIALSEKSSVSLGHTAFKEVLWWLYMQQISYYVGFSRATLQTLACGPHAYISTVPISAM